MPRTSSWSSTRPSRPVPPQLPSPNSGPAPAEEDPYSGAGRIRLVAAGRPVLWAGTDVPGRATSPKAGIPAAPQVTGSPWVGVWIDRNDFLHQQLTADGRYDETRGGRPHAYQGRFWIDGDRIDYLDDLGFWAYGEFQGDEQHHEGYVMKLG
ncbi:Atu4866 domain-containing protein [Streptomyces sp. TLI_185]|uniref:Atu4866 domain-containing protein n=1 Tax=Streptomyces sp. TLI_185 TaxID=2485151 RepID=UPI0037DA08C9